VVRRFAELAGEVLDRPARLGAVRLVVVDGPSGAGKTTFAGRLADALSTAGARVEVVHTDDLLNGWDDQFSFIDRLQAGVLAPLRRGEPGRYPCYDWVVGQFTEERAVPVPDVLIVEGGSTGRAALAASCSLRIFVTVAADLRLRRALSRDGVALEAPLRRWMAAETAHFAAEGTAQRADVLVDGAPAVRHDPRSEYVRLARPGD
jgi:uridine kinase